MIDKSVPYFDVVMVRPAGSAAVTVPELPVGYGYKLFTPGDEEAWGRIETSVDEFDAQEKALAYFQKEFLSEREEAARRIVFITGPDGKAVANAAAWWKDDVNLGRVALLHWVAVMPQAQGLGLGRAVCTKALERFDHAGPAGDIWLKTQTWSHVAIALYLSLGFCAHKTALLGGKNGFDGAAGVLHGVMKPQVYEQFVQTAIG